MGEPEFVTNDVSNDDQNLLPEFGPPEKSRRNKYAFVCAILVSLTAVSQGYDIGVMNRSALSFMIDDLEIDEIELLVLFLITSIFYLIGSLAAGTTSDWIGRRYTIFAAAVIFFLGVLIMSIAPNYNFFMVGRSVTSIGVGYGYMIAPVYIAELSPASSRGCISCFTEIANGLGILLSYIFIYAFSKLPKHLSWRFMLGVGAIPSVFLAFRVLTLPESPRWLVMQGRLSEAKRVLNKTSDTKEEADLQLAQIKTAGAIPENCTDQDVPKPIRSNGVGVWKELLLRPSPSIRRALIAAVGINFFQQSTGIAVVVLYSGLIFQMDGIRKDNDMFAVTTAVRLTNSIFTLVPTFLLDRIGRRLLILISVAGMIISLAGIGFGLTNVHQFDKKPIWAIALCNVTTISCMVSYSIGLGPITSVYSSEIFPLRLRSQGVSIGVAANHFTGGVLLVTFIVLYGNITIGWTFFMFAGIASAAWVFFYVLLPETQGKTLEEMEVLFGEFSWKSMMMKRHKKEERSNSEVQLGTNGTAQLDGDNGA